MPTVHFDADDGDDATGTGTVGNPWRTAAKYSTTDVRAPGDLGILRNNRVATYGEGADLGFDEDGDIDDPIIMRRDLANAFGDDVDLGAVELATFIFGSKIVTYAGDISGSLAVGDWIYNDDDDDPAEFAYEVAAVATATVTLFLPFKGTPGSGKGTTNIGSPPIWGVADEAFQWTYDGDNHWDIQGIHIRGTDGAQVDLDSTVGHRFRDVIFEGDGVGTRGVLPTGDGMSMDLIIHKCRSFKNNLGMIGGQGAAYAVVTNSLIDGDTTFSGLQASTMTEAMFEECEFKGHTSGDVTYITGDFVSRGKIRFRNCLLSSATPVDLHDAANIAEALFEDFNGTPGDTRQLTHLSSAEGVPILQSDTGVLRSGGGDHSILVTPSSKLSPAWEHSRVKLLDVGFNVATDSKQYNVLFRPTAAADWTTNPGPEELWVELETFGHETNNFRKITTSIGTINMQSTVWQALSVTVAPAQADPNARLRVYYAKTPDDTDTFHCDTKIDVT